MLKRIFARLKPLFFGLFGLLLPSAAFAYLPTSPSSENRDAFSTLAPVDDWSWTGRLRLQADLALDQKPSGVQGQTATEWGSLEFANLWTHDHEPYEVGLAGHFGPERDTATGQPRFEWDEARLTWTHHPSLALGVLLDPVIALEGATWSETSLGRDFKSGADRWGVLPRSDLGVQLSHLTDFGRWTLQVTNGEGWPKAEAGVRKDFELVWDNAFATEASSRWTAQAFYRRESYDQLPADHDRKERYGAQVARTASTWNFGALTMAMQDPVDGINKIEGEGVNLSAKGGQTVQGSLTEVWLRYVAGDSPHKWRALLRLAALQPDVSDAGKDVRSLVGGVGSAIGSGMQVDLLFQQAAFGETHSAPDRQRWFLAWAWGLERVPTKSSL